MMVGCVRSFEWMRVSENILLVNFRENLLISIQIEIWNRRLKRERMGRNVKRRILLSCCNRVMISTDYNFHYAFKRILSLKHFKCFLNFSDGFLN